MTAGSVASDRSETDGSLLPPVADLAWRSRLIEPLTTRELEILRLVCDGHSNQEISARLGICLPTVKYHVTNVFAKLGVCRRTQAVALAVYLQLVRPDWMQACQLKGVEHLLARPTAAALAERRGLDRPVLEVPA